MIVFTIFNCCHLCSQFTTNFHLPSSYDDPEILAGQGTVALEVIEQMDQLGEGIDAVVIPVGGGGLLAGMAATFKHLCPEITVIVRFLYIIPSYIILCFVAQSCRGLKDAQLVHVEHIIAGYLYIPAPPDHRNSRHLSMLHV